MPSDLLVDGHQLAVAAAEVAHRAGLQRVEREVAAQTDAAARMNHGSDLPHEDVPREHGLTAEDLHTAALRVAVAPVPRAALTLLVRHGSALDRVDPDLRVVLAMAPAQPVALAALVLEDADLR